MHHNVEIRQFKFDATGPKKIDLLKAKLPRKKGEVTRIKNLLQKAEQSWSSLFPIENDELYKKCLRKLEKKETELKETLTEIKELERHTK